ncbi:methyltransferase domain-containing protein [Streptomyces griseobrunneus]
MNHESADPLPDRKGLARVLKEERALPAEWASAFAAVPRESFLPDTFWPFNIENGRAVRVSRSENPISWFRYANTDIQLVTEWAAGPGGGEVANCLSPRPSQLFPMLGDLGVTSGSRILEVGTGTGWTTALLAYRARAENIVSVEFSYEVAQQARKMLTNYGTSVKVVIGGGLKDYLGDHRYDRIVATRAVHEIPAAWLRQSDPGGLIVAPWGTPFGTGRAVVRLTVGKGGESATGRFTRPTDAPTLQSHRYTHPEPARNVGIPAAIASTTSTDLTADELLGSEQSLQRFTFGLLIRNCTHAVSTQPDGEPALWLYGLNDRSWACVAFKEGAPAKVWQHGHRQLWAEVKVAYLWWAAQGRPGYERLGLTVDAEGQKVWLDDPANSWPV